MEGDMADYKEMYLKMMRASEDAIRILVQAQQECEEMYLSAESDEEISLIDMGIKKAPSNE
jgi:hypothetical protein